MIVIIAWDVSNKFNALVFDISDLALREQNPPVGDIENSDVGGGLAIDLLGLDRNCNRVP